MVDHLIKLVKDGFSFITDTRKSNKTYSLSNNLSLAFAMFHLKDASLSAFREQYSVRSENLERVYGVGALPGDTALRKSIDDINPSDLQSLFIPQIDYLRQQGVLKSRQVLNQYTVVSVDGTGHYCSGAQSCDHCLVKNHRNGKQTYYHQLLGAVAVHPDQSSVFPIACEAIVKQDGNCKNDCELNASKRILPQIRAVLPNEAIIGVFDALYLNGPHIKALMAHKMKFIIGTKGQTFVDLQAKRLRDAGELSVVEWETDDKICRAEYANGLILNGEHQDIKVNYLSYVEYDRKTGEQCFYSTWVTDLEINESNIKVIVKIARSRWKIENETFNTLKNQGYRLEHNYGHGKKYLATNFAILTFLAFLVDQICQHLDEHFQQAKQVCKSFKLFWERIRGVFYLLPTMSMNAIYRFIIKNKQLKIPPLE